MINKHWQYGSVKPWYFCVYIYICVHMYISYTDGAQMHVYMCIHILYICIYIYISK